MLDAWSGMSAVEPRGPIERQPLREELLFALAQRIAQLSFATPLGLVDEVVELGQLLDEAGALQAVGWGNGSPGAFHPFVGRTLPSLDPAAPCPPLEIEVPLSSQTPRVNPRGTVP